MAKKKTTSNVRAPAEPVVGRATPVVSPAKPVVNPPKPAALRRPLHS